MSAASSHLALQHDRCNGCGRCVSACPLGAIRVSGTNVHVDWRLCNQCCACVDVCEPRAIQRTVVPLRTAGAPSVAPGDVSKVVVGSRAEAKAVRKRAEQAAKRSTKSSGKAAVVQRTSRQRTVDGASTGVVVGLGRAASVSAESAGQATPIAQITPAESTPRSADSQQVSLADPPFGTAHWTLVDSAIVLAVLLLATLGKSAVMAIPAIGLMPAAGKTMARAGILATYYAVQLGAFALLAGRHGASLGVAFGLRRAEEADGAASAKRPSAIGSAALVAVLLVAVEAAAILYGLAMQAVGWSEPSTLSSDVSSAFGGGEIGLILAGVLVAVAAPLVEELAFRGTILAAVGVRWGMWPAIGVSAVLFAVYHASVWLFFPMLVLGVALGWLAWSRRSLWPAIVLHVLYNALAVAAAFLVPS